jgi:REP element-mobilizing transposase RayT
MYRRVIRQYFVRALRTSACHASEGYRVVYALHAHMVFVTNRRGKVFDIAHLKRLEEICRDVCCDFEAEPKEFNGERDHVHLLVIYPPKVRLSELVRSLKGVSSRLLKVAFPASLLSGRAKARCGPRAISLVRLASPPSRSLGNTSRTKGTLNPRRERRGPSRYPVAFPVSGSLWPRPGGGARANTPARPFRRLP